MTYPWIERFIFCANLFYPYVSLFSATETLWRVYLGLKCHCGNTQPEAHIHKIHAAILSPQHKTLLLPSWVIQKL